MPPNAIPLGSIRIPRKAASTKFKFDGNGSTFSGHARAVPKETKLEVGDLEEVYYKGRRRLWWETEAQVRLYDDPTLRGICSSALYETSADGALDVCEKIKEMGR